MTRHKTGTREEWLAARTELLQAEKEFTRHSDELAGRRQQLPWVPINKAYDSIPTREAHRSQTCSKGARSFWSITSCLVPTTRQAVHPAR